MCCAYVQDEPFHVRQTQRYCSGNYRSWDPKITTFPGLYIFGTAQAQVTQAILGALGLPGAQVGWVKQMCFDEEASVAHKLRACACAAHRLTVCGHCRTSPAAQRSCAP
jgi:hypothetical protein